MFSKLRGLSAAATLSVLVLGCDLATGAIEPPVPIWPELAGAAGQTAGFAAPAATIPTAGAVVEGPPSDLEYPPIRLTETGLFADVATQTLAPEVEAYWPMYELWSDDADKRRWVSLPAGAQIDSADMDVWSYPVGTKLWKEFGRDGDAIETRYMAKYGPDASDWTFMSYQWNESGTEALAVPGGVQDASGTTHDIPNAGTCLVCHNSRPGAALGFSAIQLSHSGPGLTLDALMARNRLSLPPAGPLRVPGDPVAERALGYLHANCGGCHNESSAASFGASAAKVVFWQGAARLASVEQTTTYVNMVLNTNGDLHSLRSALERMSSRPARQMPPVATEFVDHTGVALVEAWLQQLNAQFPQPASPTP